MLDLTKRRIKDITERVVFTFIGAFAAIYFVAFSAGEVKDLAFLRDPDLFDKAKGAGVVAVLALGKNLIGTRFGDKGTGSVIPSNKSEETVVLPYTYIDNPTESLVAQGYTWKELGEGRNEVH